MELGSFVRNLRRTVQGADPSTGSGGLAGLKSRKTRRQMGVKLGKLGVHYECEHTDVDPEELAREALKYFARKKADRFGQAMEAELLKERITRPRDESSTPDAAWLHRKAHQAYTAAATLDQPKAQARVLLGVV